MKVLHINSYYSTSKFYMNLYDKQIEQGLDIDVYVPVAQGFVENRELGNYTTVSKNHKKYDRYIFRLKQWKILKDIKYKYDVKNYSILHAHSLFTNGYIAYKLHKKYGTPYVVAVRNTDVNLFFKKMIHLRKLGINILKYAQKIIFISPSYKKDVLNQFIPHSLKHEIDNKTQVIPNGLDDFWLQNKNNNKTINKEAIKILHVGDVNNNKNVLTTAKVIEKMRDSGYECKFTVVGKIKNQKVYNTLLNYDFVNYISPISSKEELLKIYRSNDILVVPSIKETFGLVYVEAMTQGLPILYTKNQGFDGHIQDGKVGYRVDPYNEYDIKIKIQNTIKNYNYLSNNSVYYADKFNWNVINTEYTKNYKQGSIIQ
ncbi:glycosyltransferase family 4 protein [Alkalibacillus sp. S2W]|uniref:glycosyltransferase family 4 protein n=1 Tax=Alkalibacillus sp. S2W TaxID=3386553 RepID=UPI00398C9572